jgi:hypothetical protein
VRRRCALCKTQQPQLLDPSPAIAVLSKSLALTTASGQQNQRFKRSGCTSCTQSSRMLLQRIDPTAAAAAQRCTAQCNDCRSLRVATAGHSTAVLSWQSIGSASILHRGLYCGTSNDRAAAGPSTCKQQKPNKPDIATVNARST